MDGNGPIPTDRISMLRFGERWEAQAEHPPDLTVHGGDAELANAIVSHDHPLIAWGPTPNSDLARSIGASGSAPGTSGLAGSMDLLRSNFGCAANAIVWGTDPGRVRWGSPAREVRLTLDDREVWNARATTVVIASGEFVQGRPVAPRAHPGDGALDLIIFGVRRHQRRALRIRLRTGDHLPHPDIRTARGHRVVLDGAQDGPLRIDGVPSGRTDHLEVHIESDRWAVLL